MDKPLVLSIFPGIDLFGMALEMEGFCVVRGPDVIFGQDIRGWHVPAGKFEGVIGGPPCQVFSRLRLLVKAHGGDVKYGNLIPEFERVVTEAQPFWFIMENVPQAPLPHIWNYTTKSYKVNNTWFGGEQHRIRRFTFGIIGNEGLELPFEWPALMETPLPEGYKPQTVCAGHGGGYIYSMPLADRIRLQGLPPDFLTNEPFTKTGKCQLIGNGVPIPMGRAVAKAVKKAMGYEF